MRPVQRPADGHAAPGGGFELPSASLVRKGLEEMLSEQGVEVLDRERILGGTFPKEVVTCRRSDGTTLRVFCKYEGDSSHAEYGHRGDVEYEELVYRTLLQRMRTATPRFIGSLIDGAAGGTWLAIEYAEGADRVNHVEDAIPVAARWLGGFHAETECILEAEPDLPLKRYDADYYVGWARRTLEFAGDLLEQFRWLRPLCERFGDAAELLLAARATVAHGEFYQANVLIKGDRIYAVDWESAAVAAGEIDLATLTFGWPDEDLARSLEQYCAVRWPSGAPPEFQARLDAARVYGVLRWLGGRGVWAPSWADVFPDGTVGRYWVTSNKTEAGCAWLFRPNLQP